MKPIKKICIVTGSRADFWLMKSLLQKLKESTQFELQLIVTASHLSPLFGNTASHIESEGFEISEKLETLVSSDSSSAICKTMGLSLIDFGQAYQRLKPDLIVITGDRYEMLSAASAALISRIPICHVYGGDLTEGAYDDNIRHAITKMANIHFVSNEDSRKRIIQMGEHPSSVFTVGSPALDSILHLKRLSKDELQEELNIRFKKWNILITFHPETRANNTQKDLHELLNALSSLDENHCLIFTSPNADSEGLLFLNKIQEFAQSKDNVYFFSTLGQNNFVSLMAQVDMMVGNSSSGLYEAPSLQIPTVNIGHRQEGRLKATSVIDSQAETTAIMAAINHAKHLSCASTINPYGDGKSAEKMLDIIEKIDDFKVLLRKKFYELSTA